MVEDKTPTVTSRRRKPSGHMRLRMDTVSRLRSLGRKSALPSDQGIVARSPQPKKNKLASPPVPKAKYRKRQLHKTWLPTHMFHAKRAHMTPPSQPLWRFALPLTSTVKSYRPTHRATKDRGAVAWDVSYMSTVSVHGNEQSITSLLRALGVGLSDPAWTNRGQRWRQGSRIWQGWLYERDMFPTQPIAPATIVWRPEQDSPAKQRQIFIRLHPSAFPQLWEQLIRLAKVQKPQLTIEDLRFEIGSIEIVGPASTEALTSALCPAPTSQGDKVTVEQTWPLLAGIQNPSTLPASALLAFDIIDPRLHHPPQTAPCAIGTQDPQLLELLSEWPFGAAQVTPGIFDRARRLASCRALQSQKTINRRKSAATPGTYPDPLAQDPRIPIMAFPSPAQPNLSKNSKQRTSCSWVILLPWKTVPAVWQSLMYYPISTGGQVRMGGLNEQRQVAFATGVPWFPGDFPGTKAGDLWEASESAKRRAQWEAKPKGKRVEWDSVALGPGRKGEDGDGWACDWAYCSQNTADQSKEVAVSGIHHIAPSLAQNLVAGQTTSIEHLPQAVSTIRITLLGRGTPEPCARIYRLPLACGPEKTALRDQWLALDPARPDSCTQKKKRQRSLPSSVLKSTSTADIQQRLAADLLKSPELDNHDCCPPLPGREDLIGFVTKGEFSLTEGKGVAIGSVFVQKLIATVDTTKKEPHMCIVRNAGETVGRLGRLEFV